MDYKEVKFDSDKEHEKDPRWSTMEGFKAILDIIEKYDPKGDPIIGAAYDVVFFNLPYDLPEQSEDGLKLIRLGLSYGGGYDCWYTFA